MTATLAEWLIAGACAAAGLLLIMAAFASAFIASACARAARRFLRWRRRKLTRGERQARRVLGMAPLHPERLTPVDGHGDEAELDRWADEMWPGCEYLDILTRRHHPPESPR